MSLTTPGYEPHGGLDDLASRYVAAETLPWVDLPFPGVKGKVLLLDEEKGVMTALVRMEAGAEIPFHEHTGLEQTYMLEGTLEDHDGGCTAGQYVWRPGGNRHTARSPDGALMLVMFASPNVYLDGALKGKTAEQLMAEKADA